MNSTLTASEYLVMERNSDVKHEFYRGTLFAMAGASREHNLIVANLLRELSHLLRARPCETYPSDMRVRVEASDLYTYPDVTVVCGTPVFAAGQRDTLLNPSALFEVLSDSTEAYDRGQKFGHYRKLDTLKSYVLLSQGRKLVETYEKQADGSWSLREHAAGDAVYLTSLDVSLDVDELYLKVFAT